MTPDTLLKDRWRLAWIISESFRRLDFPAKSFEAFAAGANAWSERAAQGLKGIPHTWERDGIQAEMAARDFLSTGRLCQPRNDERSPEPIKSAHESRRIDDDQRA